MKPSVLPTSSDVIDALGGTGAVAEICEISSAAVSQWRKSKFGIPKLQLRYLREKFPQVFQKLEAAVVPAITLRDATDPAPDLGHAGRQPPSPANIFDSVPRHCVVGVEPQA